MGLLRTKERSPQEEAERQSKILTEIDHQQRQRADAERQLMAENARRRQALWEQQEQDREDRRMAAAAAVQQEQRDREARRREGQAKLNQEKIEAYRAAKQEVENIDRALAQLNVPHDLATVAGALAASEQQAKVTALRELREKAGGRLLQAERAVGRHRL